MNAFLNKINIPKTDPETRNNLEATMTCQEITQVIHAIQSGKAAGPDGFPIEF